MTDLGYDDYGDDDQDDDQGTRGGSNPLKAVRDQLKKEQKARKDAEKQVAELMTFKKEFETSKTQTLFKELGLNEKHMDTFLKANPDTEASEESVIGFFTSLGLVFESEESEEKETDQQEESNTGFAPTPTKGGTVDGKVYTRDEWHNLHTTDPAEARKAFDEGRVDGLGLKRPSGELASASAVELKAKEYTKE